VRPLFRIARKGRLVFADPATRLKAAEIQLPLTGPGQYGRGYVLMSRLPGIPLDTVREQLSDYRGAAPAAATCDQELATCGLAGLRGRPACGVPANSAP